MSKMSKRCIVISILIVVLLMVTCIYFWINRTICLSNNKDFRMIYSSQNDINNIEIDVIDERDNKISTITNREDVSIILNMIKDERINPNVKLGEVLLGGAYKFIIRNKISNNDVKVIINNTQVTINSKTYKTENDVKEKLTEIYLKYYFSMPLSI